MPYTTLDNRELLDPQIDALRDSFRGLLCDNPDLTLEEILSYSILKLFYDSYKHDITSVIEVNGLLKVVELQYNRTITSPLFNQLAFETE